MELKPNQAPVTLEEYLASKWAPRHPSVTVATGFGYENAEKVTDLPYKRCSRLWLHRETADEVCVALARFEHTGMRIRWWYGDVETGRMWMDENDVCGYIGCSMGPIRIPLCIANKRSMGGPGILEHCILRMTYANKNARRAWRYPDFEIYRHPLWHLPTFTVGPIDPAIKATFPPHSQNLNWTAFVDGQMHANFVTQQQAERWCAFMRGERGRK